MCFGGGGGGGRASLSQIRQGRGMAVQRSVGSTYTDHDYSGVTAYQTSNNTKKFKAVKALDGATVSSTHPTTGRGGAPRSLLKFASVQIADAASYNAAIDAGAKFTGKPTSVEKMSNQGRVAIVDETGARIKTRAARAQVANANDASAVSKKTKKRGGLRIDRSSSVAGGGSGVNIPS